MSDSREQAYDSITMPRVSKIREAIGVGAQSEGTSSVANEDDDPTDVLEEVLEMVWGQWDSWNSWSKFFN